MKDFEPGEDGKSPLARIESFVNCTCPKCGGAAQRETDTMPQWAGSSWYFLRYCDPHNDKAFADPDKIKYWMPVDWYNGGMEHVTRHLIYSRFWHHFLYDIGEVNTPEPYMKRSAQGMILGSDGEKMSKSRGNVVDPLDIVNQYGADTLRVYVLFMGDYGSAAPWNDSSVKGCRRFLDRVAGLTDIISDDKKPVSYETLLHKTIKKVTDDIEAQKFNTAIAALMTLLNEIYKENRISKENLTIFLKLLSPFAPHITEEIYELIGGEGFLTVSAWPDYDESKTIDAYGAGMTVTSAMKGLKATVNTLLTELILNDNWSAYGGQVMTLGLVSGTDVEANYTQIPYDTTQWGEGFTQEDYVALVGRMFSGEISVDGSQDEFVPSTITLNRYDNIK